MIIEKTVLQRDEPQAKNVLWVKPTDDGAEVLAFNNGEWKKVSGGEKKEEVEEGALVVHAVKKLVNFICGATQEEFIEGKIAVANLNNRLRRLYVPVLDTSFEKIKTALDNGKLVYYFNDLEEEEGTKNNHYYDSSPSNYTDYKPLSLTVRRAIIIGYEEHDDEWQLNEWQFLPFWYGNNVGNDFGNDYPYDIYHIIDLDSFNRVTITYTSPFSFDNTEWYYQWGYAYDYMQSTGKGHWYFEKNNANRLGIQEGEESAQHPITINAVYKDLTLGCINDNADGDYSGVSSYQAHIPYLDIPQALIIKMLEAKQRVVYKNNLNIDADEHSGTDDELHPYVGLQSKEVEIIGYSVCKVPSSVVEKSNRGKEYFNVDTTTLYLYGVNRDNHSLIRLEFVAPENEDYYYINKFSTTKDGGFDWYYARIGLTETSL